MNHETFKKSYESGRSLLQDLGFDLSADGVLDKMKLPPVSEWHKDNKLRLFVPVMTALTEKSEKDVVQQLECAIKNCRSASKASINGKILEDAVEALARRYGCEVRRNVRINSIAEESIDCEIRFSTGDKAYIMCQMDLWNGGQQTNRAEKYLNRKYDVNFISVVYNQYKPPTKTCKNLKAEKIKKWIFDAYDEKRLMWLADLEVYIKERNAES